jgi:hypothetical protein
VACCWLVSRPGLFGGRVAGGKFFLAGSFGRVAKIVASVLGVVGVCHREYPFLVGDGV